MTELQRVSVSMDNCVAIKSKWSIHFAEWFFVYAAQNIRHKRSWTMLWNDNVSRRKFSTSVINKVVNSDGLANLFT